MINPVNFDTKGRKYSAPKVLQLKNEFNEVPARDNLQKADAQIILAYFKNINKNN